MIHRCLVWLCVLFPLTLPARAAPPAKPNIVFILADDLGWTDLACFNSELYETPALDQLAKEGMRFTQNYSACTVCSPTRACILTGKYPARLHITDWIPGQMPANPKMLVPDWTKQLPLEETTIADVLRSAGYATACIGKWHLGDEPYYPEKHGFDLNIAGTSAPSPTSYFAPWKIATLPEGKDGEYLTDRLGDEAVRFIERSKDRPFFLYLAHFAVHTPIQGRADLAAKYRKKLNPNLKQRNVNYAAMIEPMDQTVARVRKALVDQGLADRTIVIFTSDNGGRVPTTSNLPLRAGKGSAYEGGVRVPLIVYWPGVTQAGSASGTPTISADFYPTLLEMAGLPDKVGHRSDGVSLTPLLNQKGLEPRDLFWHYPHHQHYQLGGSMPYGAIRSGDYRLVEFFDDMHTELYDLAADIGEQHDLTATLPDKSNELRAKLHAWRSQVNAQMPTPNPSYDPAKPQHDPTKTPAKKAMPAE
ncbi:MAG: N-acetylgalactosamine 6-sulfate sulfatase [Phycisphaerales bacterium]|nr:N-acetylgalactosamine 6-sulfate sulfatase [Phycisphaerales bacterium]